jgi:hypothetical protein
MKTSVAPLSTPVILLIRGIRSHGLVILQLVAGDLARPCTGLTTRIVSPRHILGQLLIVPIVPINNTESNRVLTLALTSGADVPIIHN